MDAMMLTRHPVLRILTGTGLGTSTLAMVVGGFDEFALARHDTAPAGSRWSHATSGGAMAR